MANLLIQIDDLVREMNPDELKEFKEWQALQQAKETESENKITARASALAKLAALGLTEEEIAAL